MIKRLILEGVDNTGKTTVAKLIKERLSYKDFYFNNIEIIHFTGPPEDESQQVNFIKQLMTIEKISQQPGNNLVITDRDIYGEMVYGPMYRDDNPDWIWELEQTFSELTKESLFILLEDSAINTLNRDDGLSFTTDHFKRYKEIRKFRKALQTSSIPYKHKVKITKKTPETVAREILQHFFKAIPMETK